MGKTDKYGRDMDDIESSDEDNYSDEEYWGKKGRDYWYVFVVYHLLNLFIQI